VVGIDYGQNGHSKLYQLRVVRRSYERITDNLVVTIWRQSNLLETVTADTVIVGCQRQHNG